VYIRRIVNVIKV